MNTMKRLIALALMLAISLGVTSGCGGSAAANDDVVYVYNWGEYIDEDVLSMFEEETGIRVVYNTFETNEGLYSRLKTESYDVVIPSDYMISRMIAEDMLQPLDYDQIPNFELIAPEFTHQGYDPDQQYSVPYTWGVVGIVYNTTKVDEEDLGSWDLLWNEKYHGKVAMFDNSRDAFGVLLKYLGYSLNTTDENELREAAQLLMDTKDGYQGFFMDQLLEKLPNEELVAAPYYNGDAVTMVDENADLGFYVPEEGSNYFFDSMCIPKNARNVENAHKFIDFMCRTDIAILNNDYIWYSTPHAGVLENLDAEILEDPLYYPPRENTEVFVNLPEEINELYVELWIDVLMA